MIDLVKTVAGAGTLFYCALFVLALALLIFDRRPKTEAVKKESLPKRRAA